MCVVLVFFFKQKTAYEMRISDWSSDVCSSDLGAPRDDDAAPGNLGKRRRHGLAEAERDDPSARGLPPGCGNQASKGGGSTRREKSGRLERSFIEGLRAIGRQGGDRKSTRLNSSH